MKGVEINEWGVHGLLLQWPAKISLGIHREVMQTVDFVNSQFSEAVRELVPTYHELAIYCNPEINLNSFRKKLVEEVMTLPKAEKSGFSSRLFTLPICYAETHGPDMKGVAGALNISVSQLIAHHTAPSYWVYGLGFLPGFPYLGGLPDVLSLPRKETPSAIVAPGSVGIGGQQTGIYPSESPGGWHIIGNCPIPLFNAVNTPPALLQAGDRVRFNAVSSEEWQEITTAIEENTFHFETLFHHG